MIDDCNINNLAKNQVSAAFNFGAHPDGHQHGGRKPTETSVTEFCYKSVNLSLEERKDIKIILFPIQEPVQIAKFPEISHFLTNSAVMQMPRQTKA